MESTDDKSKINLFVRHTRKLDLKNTITKGFVVLVKDAHRKISNQIDIYAQILFNVNNFKVIGKVKDQIADF